MELPIFTQSSGQQEHTTDNLLCALYGHKSMPPCARCITGSQASPALNGLGLLMVENHDLHLMARAMLPMIALNGRLCATYIITKSRPLTSAHCMCHP